MWGVLRARTTKAEMGEGAELRRDADLRNHGRGQDLSGGPRGDGHVDNRAKESLLGWGSRGRSPWLQTGCAENGVSKEKEGQGEGDLRPDIM